jgi:hypothetical protein
MGFFWMLRYYAVADRLLSFGLLGQVCRFGRVGE